MARIKVTETVVPEDGIDDAVLNGAAPLASKLSVPLFANAGLDPKRTPGGIGVTREDPPDGYIGYFPPHTTMEDLKRLVGGFVLSLELKDSLGQVMPGGQSKIVKIDAPPVPSAHAKQAAEDMRKGAPNALNGADPFERVYMFQRTAVEELKAQSREATQLLKLEIEGANARRLAESEASLKRMQEESRIRQEEAEAKFKRELELTRERQKQDAAESAALRASDEKRHHEFMVTLQSMQSKNTELLVASLTNKADALSVIKELAPLVAPLLPMLTGQGDPAVEISKSVSTSLESMAKLASGEKPTAPAANANPKAGGKPEGNDKKTRLLHKIGKLMQAIHANGEDPERVLDSALTHYTKQLEEPEDEVDEQDEQGQNEPEDAADNTSAQKPARRRAKRRARPARVDGRKGTESKSASGAAVEGRPRAHRRPTPKRSARGDSPRGKRQR